MKPPPTPFCRRLRRAREAAGLTQAKLALRMGVTQGIISHWEVGFRAPPLWYVRAWAMACGTEPEWLVFGGPRTGFERRPRTIRTIPTKESRHG